MPDGLRREYGRAISRHELRRRQRKAGTLTLLVFIAGVLLALRLRHAEQPPLVSTPNSETLR